MLKNGNDSDHKKFNNIKYFKQTKIEHNDKDIHTGRVLTHSSRFDRGNCYQKKLRANLYSFKTSINGFRKIRVFNNLDSDSNVKRNLCKFMYIHMID